MITLTQTKTIEFEKLIPDFKRFAASKNEARIVLKYAHYDGKYITVTDSYRLIRVNADYVTGLPYDEPFLYNVYTGESIKGSKVDTKNYPETNRLIPDNKNTSVELHDKTLKEFKNSLDELLKLDSVKKNDNKVINFEIDNRFMTVKDVKGIQVNELECFITGENVKFSINCKYMKDALITVNKLNKLSYDNPSMDIVSHLRPINICKENVFDIVVLPLRFF